MQGCQLCLSMVVSRDTTIKPMARLTSDQWDSIKTVWEYSPDEPTYSDSAQKASEKHGFRVPSRQSIAKKAKTDHWQRKASLAGINQAAHRMADKMVDSDGSKVDSKVDAESAQKEQSERSESERKRAEVRARHRSEWQQVAALRQEALFERKADPAGAYAKLRSAKVAAEITTLQQAGECRAWGLDELLDPARLRGLSDDQLEKLAKGQPI